MHALARPSPLLEPTAPTRPVGGGGGGDDGARGADRKLQSGQRPKQLHERARRARGSGQKRSGSQSTSHSRSGEAITAARADSADTALVGRGGGGYNGARGAERMLQRGEMPTQQQEHAAGGRQHRQTCPDGQSRRKARSGATITTDAPKHAVTAHEGDGGGGGNGGGGAREAR